MSHIFDALQRSEAEDSGSDFVALPGATALLQRAESRATSRWEAAALSVQSAAANGPVADTPFSPVDEQSVATEFEQTRARRSQSEKRSDPFRQFTSLQTSVDSQSQLPCLTDNGSPVAEAFRLLGVRLQHLRRHRPLKTVLITSTIPQEGKSLVASNLACTLALRSHERTLLLEGDLRRPTLSQKFGIKGKPGLCECIVRKESLTSSVYHLSDANLWILPAGNAPSNAQELLQSGRLSVLMEELTALFDWIIIDSPPVLPLADTSVWMRLADGILLVTRQGTTEKRQLQRGLEALEQRKLIGALVNESTGSGEEDYYHYRDKAAASLETDNPAA